MTPLPLLLALLAAAPESEGFRWERETACLEFRYFWPAEAEAIPALDAELRGRLDAAFAEAAATAEENEAMAREGGYPFNRHHYVQEWQAAGQSPRLLSLHSSTETYTGGAHGNLGFSALLWDRAADEAVDAAALLGPAALSRLTPRYCAALDAERAERRGEPVRRDPGDSFAACPPLAEQTLVPADADGDGRFDTLRVLIPPYVAGPWAEGPYALDVAFEPGDLAGLDAEHGPSFEAAD